MPNSHKSLSSCRSWPAIFYRRSPNY